MKTRHSAVVSAVLVMLLLTACSTSPSVPSPSTSPSITPTTTTAPVQTPSATPSPTDVPAALDCPPWTDDPDSATPAIGVNRFAGACLGMTFDEATANGTTVVGDEQCPWYSTIVADDDLGYYVAALKQGDGASDTISLFILRWFSDPKTAKDYDLPATPEGITIGSTADEVLSAYPTAHEVRFNDIARGPRTQIVVPTGATTTYNFDITDLRVNEISWGENISEGGPNGDLCAL